MWANAQHDGPLPNIGGAVCSMPQSLADAHYQPECRAVTLPRRETNPLKLAGMPQTRQRISALSGPKFTILGILGEHVEEILPFNKFFFDCQYVP